MADEMVALSVARLVALMDALLAVRSAAWLVGGRVVRKDASPAVH